MTLVSQVLRYGEENAVDIAILPQDGGFYLFVGELYLDCAEYISLYLYHRFSQTCGS